jgi:hypothetical protein
VKVITTVTPYSDNSILAHNHFVRFAVKRCGYTLIKPQDYGKLVNVKISKLIIVDGVFPDVKALDKLVSITQANKFPTTVVINDYTCRNVDLKQIPNVSVLTNMAGGILNTGVTTTTINFNKLTLLPTRLGSKKYDEPIYYGAFRERRKDSFRKYFTNSLKFYISTAKKNAVKFRTISSNLEFFDKFNMQNIYSELSLFKTALYISDKEVNDVLHPVANRFFECYSNGVVMLIDRSCEPSFNFEGYNVEEFYVDNAQELKTKWGMITKDYGFWQERFLSCLDVKQERGNLEGALREIL